MVHMFSQESFWMLKVQKGASTRHVVVHLRFHFFQYVMLFFFPVIFWVCKIWMENLMDQNLQELQMALAGGKKGEFPGHNVCETPLGTVGDTSLCICTWLHGYMRCMFWYVFIVSASKKVNVNK